MTIFRETKRRIKLILIFVKMFLLLSFAYRICRKSYFHILCIYILSFYQTPLNNIRLVVLPWMAWITCFYANKRSKKTIKYKYRWMYFFSHFIYLHSYLSITDPFLFIRTINTAISSSEQQFTILNTTEILENQILKQ